MRANQLKKRKKELIEEFVSDRPGLFCTSKDLNEALEQLEKGDHFSGLIGTAVSHFVDYLTYRLSEYEECEKEARI
jgi:hypothetical protein